MKSYKTKLPKWTDEMLKTVMIYGFRQNPDGSCEVFVKMDADTARMLK